MIMLLKLRDMGKRPCPWEMQAEVPMGVSHHTYKLFSNKRYIFINEQINMMAIQEFSILFFQLS
jgi:hypothetical protein